MISSGDHYLYAVVGELSGGVLAYKTGSAHY